MKARVKSSKFLFHIPAHMTVTVAATLSQRWPRSQAAGGIYDVPLDSGPRCVDQNRTVLVQCMWPAGWEEGGCVHPSSFYYLT